MKYTLQSRNLKNIFFILFVLNFLFSPLALNIPVASAVSCSYDVSGPSTINVGPKMGTYWITVSTQPDCYWSIDTQGTVLYNTQWLNIGFGRKGSATIGFDIQANYNSYSRTAILTIANREIKVIQSDGVLRADLSVSPTTVRPGEVATLSWTTTNAQVTSLNQGIGNVGESGGYDAKPSGTTTYTITATSAVGDKVTKSITVNVMPCTYDVSADDLQVGPSGGSRKITVTTSPGCEWSATNFWNTFGTAQPGPWPHNINSSWTGTPYLNGLRGSGTVTYVFPQHTALESRSAGATVAGQSFNFIQSGPGIPTAGLAPECLSLLGNNLGESITYEQVRQMLDQAAITPISPPAPEQTFKYGLTFGKLDSIYQSLKSGAVKPMMNGGATGVYPQGWDERFTPLAELACNGMVRGPVNGNMNSPWNSGHGILRLAWSTDEALAHGFRDATPEEYRRSSQIQYHFLAPSYVGGIISASQGGVAGAPQTIVFAASELFSVVSFTDLERALGYAPSGATTPGLYDDSQYVRYPVAPAPNPDPAPAATSTTPTTAAPTTTQPTAAPAPVVATSTKPVTAPVTPTASSTTTSPLLFLPPLEPTDNSHSTIAGPIGAVGTSTPSTSFVSEAVDRYLVRLILAATPVLKSMSTGVVGWSQDRIRASLISNLPRDIDRMKVQTDNLLMMVRDGQRAITAEQIALINQAAIALRVEGLQARSKYSKYLLPVLVDLESTFKQSIGRDSQAIATALLQQTAILQLVSNQDTVKFLEDASGTLFNLKLLFSEINSPSSLEKTFLYLRQIATLEKKIIDVFVLISKSGRASTADAAVQMINAGLVGGSQEQAAAIQQIADIQKKISQQQLAISPNSISPGTPIIGFLVDIPVGVVNELSITLIGQDNNGERADNFRWALASVTTAINAWMAWDTAVISSTIVKDAANSVIKTADEQFAKIVVDFKAIEKQAAAAAAKAAEIAKTVAKITDVTSAVKAAKSLANPLASKDLVKVIEGDYTTGLSWFNKMTNGWRELPTSKEGLIVRQSLDGLTNINLRSFSSSVAQAPFKSIEATIDVVAKSGANKLFDGMEIKFGKLQ